MRSHRFHDFDAFADSVREIDCRMMLQNPDRHIWTNDGVEIDTIDLQLGRLGSGNIAQGQLQVVRQLQADLATPIGGRDLPFQHLARRRFV